MILLMFGLSTPANASSSVVSNSVSVSSSNGVSTTKVKTVINGETVEDIDVSTTTPYRHQSSYTSDNGEATSYTNININNNNDNANSTEDSRTTLLTALLNELQTLLAYYEKLLAQQ